MGAGDRHFLLRRHGCRRPFRASRAITARPATPVSHGCRSEIGKLLQTVASAYRVASSGVLNGRGQQLPARPALRPAMRPKFLKRPPVPVQLTEKTKKSVTILAQEYFIG
jgi:hypothetical protein